MLYVIAGLLVLFVVLCLILASYITGGKRQTLEHSYEWQRSKYDTSFYDDVEKEDYLITAQDGYVLHAQLLKAYEQSSRYVIITHGYTDNRMGDLKYARFYLELGFNCVIYDIRGHGLNEKAPTTYSLKEGRDLADVVKDTRQRYPGITLLGLQGESLGAASTVMSLKYKPEVDFAVADCGFSNIEDVIKGILKSMKLSERFTFMHNIGLMLRFGCSFRDMRPVDALPGNTVPVMFIHGDADELIPSTHSQQMYDATGGYREIHLIEGAAHALSAIKAPEEYRQLLKSFIEKAESIKNGEDQ